MDASKLDIPSPSPVMLTPPHPQPCPLLPTTPPSAVTRTPPPPCLYPAVAKHATKSKPTGEVYLPVELVLVKLFVRGYFRAVNIF